MKVATDWKKCPFVAFLLSISQIKGKLNWCHLILQNASLLSIFSTGDSPHTGGSEAVLPSDQIYEHRYLSVRY